MGGTTASAFALDTDPESDAACGHYCGSATVSALPCCRQRKQQLNGQLRSLRSRTRSSTATAASGEGLWAGDPILVVMMPQGVPACVPTCRAYLSVYLSVCLCVLYMWHSFVGSLCFCIERHATYANPGADLMSYANCCGHAFQGQRRRHNEQEGCFI